MAGGKLYEVGESLSLSSQHMNLYFQNRHWDAECVVLKDRSLTDLRTWLPYIQENALLLRLDPLESKTVIEAFPQLPTDVRWLEVADTLLLEHNQWWPRLYLYEVLRKFIIHRFRDLDISMHSYVIGANPLGRVAVAALSALGFSHINLVDEDEIKLQREVAVLKRYVLGVQIHAVPAQTLTVQEHPGSLMLNTMILREGGAVLGDLSYFNFMQTGGVVVDISESTTYNQLLEEAERADLKILNGLEVQAQRDVHLIQQIFPGQYITFEDYFESFSDNLPRLKNSSSV